MITDIELEKMLKGEIDIDREDLFVAQTMKRIFRRNALNKGVIVAAWVLALIVSILVLMTIGQPFSDIENSAIIVPADESRDILIYIGGCACALISFSLCLRIVGD